jgi:Ion channel
VTSDRQRYGFLLVTISGAFFLQGVGVDGRLGDVVITALLGGGVITALLAARARPSVVWPVATLAGAVTVVSAVEPGSGAMRLANALLVAIGPPAVALGVARGFRTSGHVTIQALLGVLCIYLLIGLFFAFVFGAIERIGGEPFFANGDTATTPRCVYYSFTTLSTVGYGDLTSRSNLGHTLSVLEALFGQIYLVTVVSLFVSNLRRAPAR